MARVIEHIGICTYKNPAVSRKLSRSSYRAGVKLPHSAYAAAIFRTAFITSCKLGVVAAKLHKNMSKH